MLHGKKQKLFHSCINGFKLLIAMPTSISVHQEAFTARAELVACTALFLSKIKLLR